MKDENEKNIIDIQTHNFKTYLNSICNLNSLSKENIKCISNIREFAKTNHPIGDLRRNEQECIKIQNTLESCKVLHNQLEIMFKNRQFKYLEERKFNLK